MLLIWRHFQYFQIWHVMEIGLPLHFFVYHDYIQKVFFSLPLDDSVLELTLSGLLVDFMPRQNVSNSWYDIFISSKSGTLWKQGFH